MAFTNLQIDTDQLPRAQDIEMTPMAPAYRREVQVQLLIIFTPIFVVSWIPWLFNIRPPLLATLLSLAPVLVLLVGLLISTIARKQIAMKGYAVREHDIAYRSGLVFRKTILLPFNRVQHVEVSSGPLQRRFGLASLKFFTAGGASVDLKIDGLSAGDAEELREYILGRSSGEHST